jgi:antitoxin PrlF
MNAYFSKITSKSQTVIPREIRKHLGLKPGDRVRYGLSKEGVVLQRVKDGAEDDPFATFTEWSSADDEEAFKDL